MKPRDKDKPKRKLKLEREKLRQLSSKELKKVGGGLWSNCCSDHCTESCSVWPNHNQVLVRA